ncbi:MAG: insulinase family protein [Clostridia bacterium]|nr:insulinase family protein [Clostridia bacterium]
MEQVLLSNGIRVCLEELPHLRSISLGIWVGAGCFAETEENNGISHFIEHMVFKGTKKRSAREIAGCIDALGGQLNAYTAKECTCFYVNILREHYETAADVLCDLVTSPRFDIEDMEREKGVVLEEIAMVQDAPDEVALDLLAEAYYHGHPLGRTILGPAETVRRLTRADVDAYRARAYTTGNLVVSVAGSFDRKNILSLLEEKLADMPRGKELDKAPAFFPQKPCVKVIKKEIEQVNLCLAFPGVAQTSDEYYTQTMLANIFGGGMSSRLFQRVREEHGMTYAIYAYLSSAVRSGVFTVYAGMNPNQATEVWRLIGDEADKIARHGVTQQEWKEAREQLKGSFVLGLESASARMTRNGRVTLLNGYTATVDEVLTKIDGVSKEELDACARKTFDRSRMSAAAVGKCEEDGELVKQLCAEK